MFCLRKLTIINLACRYADDGFGKLVDVAGALKGHIPNIARDLSLLHGRQEELESN